MRRLLTPLTADRLRLTRVADDLQRPNGIIGTPDGRTLCVADIGAARTCRYDFQPDGSLTGRQLFCELGSDGHDHRQRMPGRAHPVHGDRLRRGQKLIAACRLICRTPSTAVGLRKNGDVISPL